MNLGPEPTGVIPWDWFICREGRSGTEVAVTGVACLLGRSQEGKAGNAATNEGLHLAWWDGGSRRVVLVWREGQITCILILSLTTVSDIVASSEDG